MSLVIREEKIERKEASGTVTIPAGKTFKIQTSPQGEDVLGFQVPEGQTYEAIIYVRFTRIE